MCRVWFLISWCLRSNFLIPNLRSVKSRLGAHQNKERFLTEIPNMAIGVFVQFNFFLFGRIIICFLSFFVLMQAVTRCGQSNVTQCHNLLTCGELNSLWFKNRKKEEEGVLERGKEQREAEGRSPSSIANAKRQSQPTVNLQIVTGITNRYYSV